MRDSNPAPEVFARFTGLAQWRLALLDFLQRKL